MSRNFYLMNQSKKNPIPYFQFNSLSFDSLIFCSISNIEFKHLKITLDLDNPRKHFCCKTRMSGTSFRSGWRWTIGSRRLLLCKVGGNRIRRRSSTCSGDRRRNTLLRRNRRPLELKLKQKFNRPFIAYRGGLIWLCSFLLKQTVYIKD